LVIAMGGFQSQLNFPGRRIRLVHPDKHLEPEPLSGRVAPVNLLPMPELPRFQFAS